MSISFLPQPPEALRLAVSTETLHVSTRRALEFVDLSERVAKTVAASGIVHGVANIQVRHTSAALVVNENEPLLLEDFARFLSAIAPAGARYLHDRFDIRTVNLAPGERPNGHAHARALLLRTSECLNVVEGQLQLGRWQRIFLVELDTGRDREVSIMLIGAGGSRPKPARGLEVESA